MPAVRDYIGQVSSVYGRHMAARLFDRADPLAAHPAAVVDVLTVTHGRQCTPERPSGRGVLTPNDP